MSANIQVTGISQVIRGRYTNSLGWLPGVAVVDIIPQASIPYSVVSVSFTDGANTVTLQDCRIDQMRAMRSTRGAVMRLWIKDRRWRWEGLGHISGTYNIPKADGTIWSASEKTPRQLMSLVLDALGETGYSVTNLPNSHRPFVSWEMAVPAQAGDALLRDAGCDIAYNPFANSVGVVQLGYGTIPGWTNVSSISTGIDVAELPSEIIAVAGRTRFQAKFKLKPKAIETTGVVVDADAVSYEPAGGWTDEDDPEDLLSGGDPLDAALANGSVFRIYETETLASGTLVLPGYGSVSSRDLMLPILDTLNTTWTAPDGQEIPELPYTEGSIAVEDELIGLGNSDFVRIDEPFTIDNDAGQIRFSRPVYKLADGVGEDGIDFPDLYLTVCCHLRDSAYKYHRYSVSTPVPGAPTTPPLVIRAEDIEARYTAVYDTDGTTLLSTTDNLTEVQARLNEAINAQLGKYITSTATVVKMNGIKLVALSGQVQSVTWNVQIRANNEDECVFTVASVNTESEPGVPLARERARRIGLMALERDRRLTSAERFRQRIGRKWQP